ncbi:MAG: ABC transporter permease [Peptococcaceae bacterium]|nr:ABC transporter permease [Peptococcaceae bacterium]
MDRDYSFQRIEKIQSKADSALNNNQGQYFWRRFAGNPRGVFGLSTVVLLIILAVFIPWFSQYSYDYQNLSITNQPPGQNNWFGTDSLGRDLFVRVWYGARISLFLAFSATGLCLVIGVVYGGISGFIGGWLDEVMMRFIEVLSSIPFLLYVVLLMVWMGSGLKAVFIALASVYWLTMARVVRGQVVLVKTEGYVQSAWTLGVGTKGILFRHIFPNIIGTIIVTSAIMIPEIVFAEAWLSFLGLGVSIPMASWGALASEGIEGFRNYPWQLFFPAFFISLTMLSFNFLGDGLREAMDPKFDQ